MIFRKKHKIPIFFGDLIVFINNNFKAVSDKYKLELPEEYHSGFDALVNQFYTKNGCPVYYVILDETIKDGTIVHESKHIVNRIFKDRGIELDLDNDETECYLLEWVFQTIKNDYLKFKSLNDIPRATN